MIASVILLIIPIIVALTPNRLNKKFYTVKLLGLSFHSFQTSKIFMYEVVRMIRPDLAHQNAIDYGNLIDRTIACLFKLS